ncbi:MAG: hypothetical protein R2877_05445 [Bdellovibrionota bacterium]
MLTRELLLSIAKKWLDHGVRARKPRRRKTIQAIMEDFPLTRKIIFKSARKKYSKATQDNILPLFARWRVIEKTYRMNDPYRYDLEAQKIGSLIASPISKSLIALFFAMEKVRKTKHSLHQDRFQSGCARWRRDGRRHCFTHSSQRKMGSFARRCTRTLAQCQDHIFDLF